MNQYLLFEMPLNECTAMIKYLSTHGSLKKKFELPFRFYGDSWEVTWLRDNILR